MKTFSHHELIVISKKIYKKNNSNTKALLLSVLLHAMLLAATISVVVPKKHEDTAAMKNTLSISLANYTAQAPVEKVVQEKIEPKKAVETPKKQPAKIKPKPIKTPQQLPQPVIKANAPFLEPCVHQETSEAVREQTHSQDLHASLEPQTPSTEVQLKPKQESSINPTTLGLIRAMIQEALRYPALAKRLKIEGVVLVSFVLTQDGRVVSANVVQKSGSSSLDDKALETVLSLSGTYPLLPTQTNLQIPIAFSLKQS